MKKNNNHPNTSNNEAVKNSRLVNKNKNEENVSPEVIKHLEESIKKNYKIGELLAK